MFRVVAFLGVFFLIQFLYGLAQGTWFDRWLIDQLTVGVAAALIALVDPSAQVFASGSRLLSPHGGINVLHGCEGTDVAFLLVSSMLVAPLAWRQRVWGMVVGLVFVFVINQWRVVALFYAFRHDKSLFDALHGLVTPILLIAFVSLFFFGWLSRCQHLLNRDGVENV